LIKVSIKTALRVFIFHTRLALVWLWPRLKEILLLCLPFLVTAVMLTLAQAPIGWWPVAWAAYVPFIVACTHATKAHKTPPIKTFEGRQEHKSQVREYSAWTLCFTAYVVGTLYWLGNIYWMSFVTVSGWIAFCLYTALLWPILAMSLRWCRIKRIPLFIAVPVLVVGVEQSQGFFLGGFYWHHLAHSQYSNTALIQIADIFGAAGVSFLVAMVNGLIAEVFVVRRSLFIVRNLLLLFIALVGVLVYGSWRIRQSDKYVTAGPMVAAVQTNVPQSVKESFAAEEQILDELLNYSNQCVSSGAQLIVWPETMVQAILEPQVLRLLDDSHSYNLFDKVIIEHARKGGVYVLVGAYGGSPRIEENFDIRLAQKYNAAFLYTPDGNKAPQKYYKIHLVPFGEFIPFKSVPFIHNLLLKMTPYDFDYTLDPGSEYTAFEMKARDTNEVHRFGVMICYEDAVPVMARRFALGKDGNRRIDWLVNISNDGWFVRFKGDRVLSSTELAQHTAVCVFRAVENRLAILRSVNTGISCIIDTVGNVKDGFQGGNLPQRAFGRQGVAGWFADTIPIDFRVTFFSKYGQWLDFSCQLCLAVTIIAQFVERFVIRQRPKGKSGK
jgi:apolipoprotein N-acyltransferase